MRLLSSTFLIALACTAGTARAGSGVPTDLPYPTGVPSAEQVAEQVYFANHFYTFKNFGIRRKRGKMSVIIDQLRGSRPSLTAIERFINNNYHDSEVRSKDMALFRSGKMKGTGMLITDYVDPNKSQSYEVWLPELRKVRRFAQPAPEDAWGGTVFTFGDVTLRSPKDETHKLLGIRKFSGCLGAIKKLRGKRIRYAGTLPQNACRHRGKKVYILKSTHKNSNWWYDYRISYVDTKSFADYRTVYFKKRGGQKPKIIKVIDRDWGRVISKRLKDPRALFWKYWYGIDVNSGHETWAVVPDETIEINARRDASFWSVSTLTKLRR